MRPGLILVAHGHDLLDGPHGQPFGHDPVRQTLLGVRVVQGQQSPGVPGTQHTGRDAFLYGGRQVQQAEGIGDVRAGTAYLARQLLVRRPEIIEQLLVRGGLFQRIELLAVQVLDQSVAQQVGVGGLTDDGRDHGQAGSLAGPPAPLTHDQLIVARHHHADHDRLKKAYFPDGGCKLVQRLLVKGTPRLTRIGGDGAGGQLLEVGPRDRLGAGLIAHSRRAPLI